MMAMMLSSTTAIPIGRRGFLLHLCTNSYTSSVPGASPVNWSDEICFLFWRLAGD